MSRAASQAILLVDGYNMVGAWSGLQQKRDRHGLEEARRELVEMLIEYSAFNGYETQVVFDAQYQDRPGSKEVRTPYLSVYYTEFQQTADTYIELTCSRFRNDLRKFEKHLIVATSDNVHRQTVIGYGAVCISALQLLHEIETVGRQVRHKQRSKGRSHGRFLMNSLDPSAQERLSKLRFGNTDGHP